MSHGRHPEINKIIRIFFILTFNNSPILVVNVVVVVVVVVQ